MISDLSTEMLTVLLRDLHADRSAYARLRDLLEAQFEAALRHRSQVLAQLADEVFALADELGERATRRSKLLRKLLGQEVKPSMSLLLRRLPETLARNLEQAWQSLEKQVRDCQSLNQRNCQFITEQHALMQRVLGAADGGLYAAP